MLYVKHTDGECHPVVRCHGCDATIEDIAHALILYPAPVDDGRTVRVCIVHRDECLDAVVESLTTEHGPPHRLELADFLARIKLQREVAC